MKEYIEEVQKIIGIKFNEPKLLVTALTHSSYANQHREEEYNERFEFLGDSILQLTITEYLFLNFKDKSEGELTKIRSLIVCENSLYEIGKSLDLGNHLRMSKGEELTGGRERVSLIADAVEALIAAIYLDKGLEYAKDYIIGAFKTIIKKAIIVYELIKFEGPPHRRKFYTKLIIDNKEISSGEGYSKKESEQDAAKIALKQMEKSNE